jgi:hypothetical protein
MSFWMTGATSTVGAGGAEAEATRRSHPALTAPSRAPTTAINFRDFQVLAALILSSENRSPQFALGVAVVFYDKFAPTIKLARFGASLVSPAASPQKQTEYRNEKHCEHDY